MLVFVCVFCVQQSVSVAGVGLKPQGLCTWGDKDAGAAAGQLEGLSRLPGLNSFVQRVYSILLLLSGAQSEALSAACVLWYVTADTCIGTYIGIYKVYACVLCATQVYLKL